MKKYKYKGDAVMLGRHGKVKDGQVLTMTEHEAYQLSNAPTKCLVPIRDVPPAGFPTDPGLPPSGGHFDLSKLRWKTRDIFKDVHRLRRVKLMAALSQLEKDGFPIPKVNHRTDQDVMRDIILTTARFANWI